MFRADTTWYVTYVVYLHTFRHGAYNPAMRSNQFSGCIEITVSFLISSGHPQPTTVRGVEHVRPKPFSYMGGCDRVIVVAHGPSIPLRAHHVTQRKTKPTISAKIIRHLRGEPRRTGGTVHRPGWPIRRYRPDHLSRFEAPNGCR